MAGFTELVVEEAALGWLETLGYEIQHGPDIAAGEPGAERSDPNYRDVILERRLIHAIERLNSNLPRTRKKTHFGNSRVRMRRP